MKTLDNGKNGMLAKAFLPGLLALLFLSATLLPGTASACRIGNFVWLDANCNGIQDAGEQGIPGVKLILWKMLDSGRMVRIGSTATDQDGKYEFNWENNQIESGRYIVSIPPESFATVLHGLAPAPSFVSETDPPDPDLDMEIDSNGHYMDTFFQSGPTKHLIVGGVDGTSYDMTIDFGFCLDHVTDCGPCDGKVTQLTLLYNGYEAADIRVEQKKGEVVFTGTVNGGESFTFSGQDKNGTLGTNISVYVNNVLNTEIHTSCSQPIGPGMEFGDFLITDGYSRNGGQLCPEETSKDYCKDYGKPGALTMIYTGESCSASHHSQAEGKVVCTGDPRLAPLVHIIVSDTDKMSSKSKKYFEGDVPINGQFIIDAANAKTDRLSTNTCVFIYSLDGRTLLQTVQFHTSCSQPLIVGDQFGSLKLVGFKGSGDKKHSTGDLNDGTALQEMPNTFALYQNYANPFNPETEIQFQLAESEYVTLTIYNSLGQKVRTLAEGDYGQGTYKIRWNGTDDDGKQVSGGVYLYQIKAGEFTQVRSMNLVR